MQISAIVAMTENRVIGINNQLPWKLPADLRHFKALTLGKPILMGRKTYESIGRVLPGRANMIISHNEQFQVPGARIVHSVDGALRELAGVEEIMVIGGAGLYQEMLPQISRMYITLIHTRLEGDVYFPELKALEWRRVSSETHEADEENIYSYSFETWERI